MKELTYSKEEMFFSPYAVRSKETRGRLREEQPCELRTDFQRDRDRLIYCKAFRRLKNKTQVFMRPIGDHFRTRLTHTLTVAQISRTIARLLSLNEDLTEAISYGHDLGHTPFGHAGERTLARLTGGEFSHEKQSLRVVDVLENGGKGLNLTFEVRDGILNHKMNGTPSTLEGKAVSYADRIAYINHDIDDAIRAGVLSEEMLPRELTELLGHSQSERIDRMIRSIYTRSQGKNLVEMEDDVREATNALRTFMFENVYMTSSAKEEEVRVDRMLSAMFEHYMKSPESLPAFYRELGETWPLKTVVCDYLSSMSDTYATRAFEELFMPRTFEADER